MNFFKQKFIYILQKEQGCSWSYEDSYNTISSIPVMVDEDYELKAQRIIDSYQDCYRLFGTIYAHANRYNVVTSLCFLNGCYQDCVKMIDKLKKCKNYHNTLSSLVISPGFSIICNGRKLFFNKSR